MLTGYGRFKEIIVSTEKSDDTVKGMVFRNKDAALQFIERNSNTPILQVFCTDPSILTIDLFNDGFDLIITNNFDNYFRQSTIKKFVKFYHYDGKCGLIWSTRKKFITKDDIHVNSCIGRWMVDMMNINKKKKG